MSALARESLEGSFAGEIVTPAHPDYDLRRGVWNAMVDRRPALIARCRTADDVAGAIRFARDAGLEIGVKCGGHSALGHAVPDGGLMIDLGPMDAVRVDPDRRTAVVQGGALLRYLDRSAAPHGLATTAGNVSHTGVGGLTLGGGMGWLARQFGLACDNVAAYTLVTADGSTVRASPDEHPDLYWGLRGGGGNFGVVTEFEFRLHPVTGQVVVTELTFDMDDAARAMRAWRDLLPVAPREATLTVDAITMRDDPGVPEHLRGRPVLVLGYVWAGRPGDAEAWLPTFRAVGEPVAEHVRPMSYVELQSIGDDRHHHGLRRYGGGHLLAELSDAAIDAFLTRGAGPRAAGTDWTRMPAGGFQAYGGAIADTADGDAAFGHRNTLVEFFCGTSWADPAEDEARISAARAWNAAVEPYASGVYVNSIGDAGAAGVRRAYPPEKLARLTELKGRYDPDNVFHLNQNIRPPEPARPR